MPISESKLLPSLASVHRYNARDIADLTFLYLVSLCLLRNEWRTSPFARHYAQQTLAYSDWSHPHSGGNDLCELLSITLHHSRDYQQHLKNQTASIHFLQDLTLDTQQVKRFLRLVNQAPFDNHQAGRLLFAFERDLRISETNYKSVRRIVSDWNASHVDHEAKSLAVTRLLQAMRHRAVRGDLLPQLEILAHDQKLELKDVCDPETGKGCETPEAPPRMGLLKKLVIGAGLGIGAYYLGKALAGGFSK